MNDSDFLQKYDNSKMYEIYDEWPEIAKNNFQTNFNPVKTNDVDHIVFAGMGGSGALGDIFSAILSRTRIHVSVVKGYSLPKTVDKKTLVVVTSVSGNTREALSVLNEAKKINSNIIAFSAGGLIEKFCIENNIEYRKIQQLHSPRASFTAFLYGMIKILKPILPIHESEIKESINELAKLKGKISSKNLNADNTSLQLAKWISDIPIIYYPAGFEAVAIRFKNSIQENAKMHAISENVIESCHNGIVSWESTSNIKPILLRGKDDHEKTKERWEILKEFFEKRKIEYWEINSIEGNILSKIISLIYQLDYASIYLAVLNNINPSPVESINFIKSKLS